MQSYPKEMNMIKEYGYEYDAALNSALWEETQGRVSNDKLWGAHCLRSGRDALKAIAKEYEPRIVLLPALSCDSMVSPFTKYHHKVVFYKLNQDYSIDIDDLEKKIDIGKCIFLYMNYFGCQALTDEELQSLKSKFTKMIFIEDRTHTLIWENKSNFKPDYIVASLRKWIAIPDGGLLWGDISKQLLTDTTFSSTRLRAQIMRHTYLKNGDENLKVKFRKIFSTVSDVMDLDEPTAISAYSYALASETNWDQICSQREKNAKLLKSILAPYVSLIEGKYQSALYVPFIISNRDEIQKTLSAQGIFNTIIWPLSDQQKKICKVAKHTEEYMLAAPCDQRYSEQDMEYIGKEIVKVILKRG